MASKATTDRPDMIYSPRNHIPLGEAVVTDSGSLALKIKRNNKTEIVTLESLYTLVHMKAAEKTV